MPASFSSAARNLFLLGSSGEGIVSNFFKSVDKSSNPSEGKFIPSQIKYNYSDEKYVLAGTGLGNDAFGWIEKRDYDGDLDSDPSVPTSTEEWGVRINPTVYSSALTLNDMKLDYNDNVIVVGKSGGVNGDYGNEAPYIAKYSNAGVLEWQSTSFSGDVEYTGVSCSSNGNYYVCGNTPESGEAVAFVEKFDYNGNPLWGKSAFMLGRDVVLNNIAANWRDEVVAVGYLEDDSSKKGYIAKIDTTTGEVLWDRTIRSQHDPNGLNPYQDVICKDIFIDSNDQIYIVGNTNNHGFIIKYTAEGNIIWQKQTDKEVFSNFSFDQIFSDDETEQAVVFGTINNGLLGQEGILSKYSKNGDLVWRRALESSKSSGFTFNNVSLDADQSFYYLLFNDQTISGGDPTKYTFGKVSSSGNGLGDFQYSSDTTTTIDYKILSTPDEIGRLSDGSVRNNTSDLISYPFSANKLVFDDLATHVSNKSRQMDSADSFQYSGSPAIRVADLVTREYTADEYGLPPQRNYIGLSESLQPSSTSSNPTPNNTWTRQTTNTTVTANALGNPIGVGAKAEKYNISATTGRRLEYGVPSGVFVSGQQYTYSWWMKAITTDARWAFQALQAGSSNNSIRIADKDGNILEIISTTNTTNYKPKDTEWHRVVWTFTANNTTGSAVGGYNDNGETGDLWYLWGAQLVDGSDPGKYYRNITGTPENATGTEHAPSIVNGVYEFDQTEMLQIGEVQGIGDEFTLELWFKSDTHTYYQNPIDCNFATNSTNGSNPSGNIGPRLEIRGDGLASWIFGATTEANDPYFAIQNGTLSTGVWYHSVITYGGGGATDGKAYINGEYVNQSSQGDTGTTAWIGEFRNLVLGRGFSLATRYFDGQVGGVRIYPKVLTAAQVYQNYNATKTKYINEAPDTAPKIGPGIVYGSNLLLNYDFGNRATYDRAQNLLKDNFTDGTDTGEYYTDEIGVRHKIYTKDANLNQFFGDVDLPAGTYYLVVKMYVDLTDATSFDARPEDFLGAPLSADVFESVIPALGSKGIMRLRYKNVQAAGTWVFAFKGTGTAKFARPSLDIEPYFSGASPTVWYSDLPGKYIKTYGSAITAPTTVKNLSNTSNTGGVISSVEFNTDGWMDFSGTNSQIVVDSNLVGSGLIGTGDANSEYTLEAWIYVRTSSGSTTNADAIMGHTSDRGVGFQVGVSGSQPRINYGARFTSNFYGSTFNYNEWRHIVLTRDGTTGAIAYENNTQVGSLGTADLDVESGFTIGDFNLGYCQPRISGRFDGLIGEVRVYNRALTATEVSQNFNATKSKYGL